MYIDSEVKKIFNGEEKYDKFSVAAMLSDLSLRGASCSLKVPNMMADCDDCQLSFICRSVDEIIKKYIERTTVVMERFTFKSK